MINITDGFLVGDLFDYMIINDCDVLEELSNFNIDVITDLICMSNKVSRDEALAFIDACINKYGVEPFIKKLGYEVIGCEPSDDESAKKKSNDSFLGILEDYYDEIQTVDNNISLSEFKGMTTQFLFKYAEGLKHRYIFNKNKELQGYYEHTAMIISGLAGKLEECPQFNDDGTLHKQTLEDKVKKMRDKFQ